VTTTPTPELIANALRAYEAWQADRVGTVDEVIEDIVWSQVDRQDNEEDEVTDALYAALQAAAIRAGDIDPTPASQETIVEVPGTLTAHYQDGRITQWVWSPSASYAGYFGPAAQVVEGDESLDVTSTFGPFWTAVRANPLGEVDWQE
jgi:hypothetical protein